MRMDLVWALRPSSRGSGEGSAGPIFSSVPATGARHLNAARFFEAVVLRLLPLLPIELRGLQHRRDNRLLKVHYGHPETHFEVWHHLARRRLEVGLHLEGRPALNAAGLAFLRSRMVEIRGGLEVAELEPWERGWVRIYETSPAPELDAALAELAGRRLAAYIVTLQPLLEEFWEQRR